MPRHHDGPIARLHAAIHACQATLTATDRRIAAYLLEQTPRIALLSVPELAGAVGSSPASVGRLLQKVGYSGLAELKHDLKPALQVGESPLERFRTTLRAGGAATGLADVVAIARQEARNIEATIGQLDEPAFRRAVEVIGRSTTVYAIGVGVSAHVAGLAAFLLQRIGVACLAVQHTGLNMAEQLVPAARGDALMAFSFPPYSPQTVDAATLARRRGARVVSITNQAGAPIAGRSDVVLVARTDTLGPSNALAAPLVLVQGLAAAVAAGSRRRSLRAMKATLAIRKEQ